MITQTEDRMGRWQSVKRRFGGHWSRYWLTRRSWWEVEFPRGCGGGDPGFEKVATGKEAELRKLAKVLTKARLEAAGKLSGLVSGKLKNWDSKASVEIRVTPQSDLQSMATVPANSSLPRILKRKDAAKPDRFQWGNSAGSVGVENDAMTDSTPVWSLTRLMPNRRRSGQGGGEGIGQYFGEPPDLLCDPLATSRGSRESTHLGEEAPDGGLDLGGDRGVAGEGKSAGG